MRLALLISLCFFFCKNQSYAAKERFIKVISHNKYGYEISNPSGMTFSITHQASEESSPITFTLAPGHKKVFNQRVARDAWIRISYPQRFYLADQARYKRSLNALIKDSDLVNRIFLKVEGGILSGPNSQEVLIEKKYYDGRVEYQRKTEELITAKILLGLVAGSYFQKLQAQIQQNVNRILANATISQQLRDAEIGKIAFYAYAFETRKIYSEAKNSNMYWYIGSDFHFEYSWNLSGTPGQNDFWRNSAGQGWMTHFGLPLEFSTSKRRRHAARFYLSFFEDRVRHRLDSIGDFYIPRSLVKNPEGDQEFFLVNEGSLNPRLNATRYGTGLTVRWGPVLGGYLSATAGFTFHTRSMLHLRYGWFSDVEPQYSIFKRKQRAAIEVRSEDQKVRPYFTFSYAFIPGLKIMNSGDQKRVSGMPWIISTQIFPPIGFVEGEDFPLFIGNGLQASDPDFAVRKVPILGSFPNKSWRVVLRIGVGIST